MNAVGIWFCKNCKKRLSVALLAMPDWNKRCLLCGSLNLIKVGEVNPNDPQAEEIEKEIVKRIEELKDSKRR